MKSIVLIILGIFVSISCFGEWVDISDNPGEQSVSVVSSGLDRSEISFSLSGYNLDTVVISGKQYHTVSLPEEGELIELGKPSLPTLTRLLAIPDNGNISYKIISKTEQVLTDIDLLPRQSIDNPVNSGTNEFLQDEIFYRAENKFPASYINLSSAAIMRGVRTANITINPFQYDPQNRTLTIVTSMSVEITTDQESGINPVTRAMKRSRFFEPILESSVLNYSALANFRNEEYQQPCYLFIYADEDLLTLTGGYNLLDVIDWKKQKGFEVHTMCLDDIGSTTYSIENAIQNAYDNWENPPEFVCLVGDPSSYYTLPSSSYSYGATDHYYSLVDGNDLLADVIIGRLSVDSDTDMKVIANKILGYEKTPYTGNTEWFTDVLLVGDPSSSGPSTISTCKFIKDIILDHNDTFTFNEHYGGSAGNFFQNSLNNGVSYFAYRGYIGMSGIPSYINSVNNGWMTPFVACLTCGTGNFDGEATSEAFLEAGSITLPSGGIAAVGTATTSTHTAFNNIVTGGMFQGIFHDGIYNPGGSLVRGKLALYNNYFGSAGQSGATPFLYWNNLMGDPAIELWTGVPQQLNVIYNNSIPSGTNYLEVYVEDNEGFALENAWVTAFNEDLDIFATGFTDASGFINLPVDINTTGSAALTVTAHNFVPHLGSIQIIQPSYFLAIEDYVIDDDMAGNSSGNGDGLANPGETIELNLGIKNFGSFLIEEVTADLTSSDAAVTILSETMNYGDIPAGETYYNDGFLFSLDNTLCNGDIIELELEMTGSSGSSWTDIVLLSIAGPDLTIIDYIVSDGANGVLEPGETSNFKVVLKNNGLSGINELAGILNCYDERITINDAEGYWGDISSGQQVSNVSDVFNISANYSIINGSQIPMYVELFNEEGFEQTLNFNIEVGLVNVNDPLGPDAYGYYCYDDGDLDYPDVPEYNWIEIDPNEDDNDYEGTVIDMDIYSLPHADGGSGDIVTVDLPATFTFQFYGEIYDEISICSNGFITPGIADNFEFMNWNIPGAQVPSPLIAPFWDELHYSSNSNVFYYYNSSEHYFVVEWINTRNQQNHNETFQAILYDANFYNTTTNDSKIKFQYNDINNTDVGSYGYPVNHGLYATVGIVDPTNSIGLQYTCNNEYPAAAKQLQDEMALLFAPTPIPTSGPYVYISNLGIYSGSDNIIEAGETAYCSVSLKNIGPDIASDVSMELILEDEYVTITDDDETFGDITSGEIVTINNAYIMEISEEVPNQHFISITALITSDEEIWERNINLIIYAYPALAYTPHSFDIELDENETLETTMELTNIVVGSGALTYQLRTEPLETSLREIENSYVACNVGTFEPGESVNWTLTAYNWSTDSEWITDINIHFPYGVTVISATDFTGGTGGDMVHNGVTGENVELNWHGATALGYGYLHQNQHATAVVSVEIEEFFSGNIVLEYELIGDGYGEEPHSVSGEITLHYPLGWISVYPPVGVITGGETDILDVTFDTSQLTYGTYGCEIIINTGSDFEPRIPVTLNVVSTDTDDPVIPQNTKLTGNFPNPFNPETSISFQLSENSNTELTIYNLKGQLVKKLINAHLEAGVYDIRWNGTDDRGNAVTSGIYFYKFQAGKHTSVKKMILMK